MSMVVKEQPLALGYSDKVEMSNAAPSNWNPVNGQEDVINMAALLETRVSHWIKEQVRVSLFPKMSSYFEGDLLYFSIVFLSLSILYMFPYL